MTRPRRGRTPGVRLTPSRRAALVRAARQARAAAYAPYSGFAVGAAVLTADGTVVTGCNVENASYGLSVCAERAAVHRAVAEGHRRLVAVAVASGQAAAPPCGACRQVMQEFGVSVVVVDRPRGAPLALPLTTLLAHPFLPTAMRAPRRIS